MAKYKLKVPHLLKNNIVGKRGTVVDESKFIDLNHSLSGNYVEKVKDESKKDEPKKDQPKKDEPKNQKNNK